jgi:hypothetical protein
VSTLAANPGARLGVLLDNKPGLSISLSKDLNSTSLLRCQPVQVLDHRSLNVPPRVARMHKFRSICGWKATESSYAWCLAMPIARAGNSQWDRIIITQRSQTLFFHRFRGLGVEIRTIQAQKIPEQRFDGVRGHKCCCGKPRTFYLTIPQLHNLRKENRV